MNEAEWEEFWAYLVGDYSIMESMGPNHLDTVGAFLEWQRREWIKHHKDWPSTGMVRAGRLIISEFTTNHEEGEDNE